MRNALTLRTPLRRCWSLITATQLVFLTKCPYLAAPTASAATKKLQRSPEAPASQAAQGPHRSSQLGQAGSSVSGNRAPVIP
ncbi:hypothetical protein NDU88_002071 [Pleurodeles waltl]|uniref:Secreted protein n=1 Tax=Pleurodeles waltl TaxID=8319 RepID=A0AAV7PAL2_PLEWA|nr:hypothetical protein NDU88_002071 [Pleurodeles waltl]